MIKTRRPKAEQPRQPITAKVDSELKGKLETIAKKEDRSLSQIIERLLSSHPDISKTIAA